MVGDDADVVELLPGRHAGAGRGAERRRHVGLGEARAPSSHFGQKGNAEGKRAGGGLVMVAVPIPAPLIEKENENVGAVVVVGSAGGGATRLVLPVEDDSKREEEVPPV